MRARTTDGNDAPKRSRSGLIVGVDPGTFMGRLDKAQAVVATLRTITPVVVPEVTNYRDAEQRDLFLSGLRLAMGDRDRT
jgi:hypothetical protein